MTNNVTMTKFLGFLFSVVPLFPLCAQAPFPNDLLGVWRGTLYIYSPGALQDSTQTQLTIATTTDSSAWTWKTEYFTPKAPVVKDYVLRKKDGEHHYVIDEGDGIVLDTYRLGNQLLSTFEVQGALLTSRYRREGDQLTFEITSAKPLDTTQGVTSYSVISLQRAVLRRIE